MITSEKGEDRIDQEKSSGQTSLKGSLIRKVNPRKLSNSNINIQQFKTMQERSGMNSANPSDGIDEDWQTNEPPFFTKGSPGRGIRKNGRF